MAEGDTPEALAAAKQMIDANQAVFHSINSAHRAAYEAAVAAAPPLEPGQTRRELPRPWVD